MAAAASFDAHYDEVGGDLLLSAGDYMYNCQEEIGFDYDDLDLDNNDVPFPPAISEYTKSDTRQQPLITFDKAKKTAFKQAMEEVKYFRDKLGHGTKGVDNAFDIMFGEDSELFSKFNVKFGIKSFEVYSRFMATFFIECCLSTNYSKLCSLSLFDNTGFLSPKEYNEIWTKIDNYHKKDKFSKRSWEEIEEAFNDMAKEIFVPTGTPPEFVINGTIDDDKHHHNGTVAKRDQPLDEETNLSIGRHVKENAPGPTVDATVLSASGIVIHLHYRRPGETEFESIKATFKSLFKVGEGKELPNLSGKVSLAADRGYWRPKVLYFLIAMGVDIWGTIMRLAFVPLTWGKKKKKTNNNKKDEPTFIDVEGPPLNVQVTAEHNLGNKSNKDHKLTVSCFRNGVSSAAALTVSTMHHTIDIDFVISTAAGARRYFDSSNEYRRNKPLRFMLGFTPLYDATLDQREVALLINNFVYPLTMGQNDHSWRRMRGYSCTSSTMDKVIRAKAPHINYNHHCRGAFEAVLQYAGLSELVPDDAPSDSDAEEDEDMVESSGSDCESTNTITDAMVVEVQTMATTADSYTYQLPTELENPEEDEEEGGDADNNDEPPLDGQAPANEDTTTTNQEEESGADSEARRLRGGNDSDGDYSMDEEEQNSGAEAEAEEDDADASDTELESNNDGGGNGDDDDADNEDDTNAWWNQDMSAEDFMSQFFDHQSSAEYEQLRQSEAETALPSFSDAFVQECLALIHGAPNGRNDDHRRELLLAWIRCNRTQRVTYFLTHKECKQFNTDHNLGMPPQDFNGLMSVVRAKVAKALERVEYPDEGVNEDEDVATGPSAHIVELLSSTFLKRLKKGKEEGQQSYSSGGHRAEKPFMKQFVDALKRNNDGGEEIQFGGDDHPMILEDIYIPGLVAAHGVHHHSEHKYLRTSADGVVIYYENVEPTEDEEDSNTGITSLMPVECKSRQTPRTWSRERNRLNLLRYGDLYSHEDDDVALATIDSHRRIDGGKFNEDDEMKDLKLNPGLAEVIPDPHELMQCLHHAATFGAPKSRCLFLVGNDVSLMGAYIINFPPALVEAYEEICRMVFEEDLKWAYERTEDDSPPEPPIEWLEAFKNKKLKYLKMDKESFLYDLAMWRVLNVHPDTGKFPKDLYTFPLPVTSDIRSITVSLWDAFKGGGDGATKQLDRHPERIGIRTLNTTATARIFKYFAITFHRVNQWCNAAKDLRKYPSLQHARHANNERASNFDSYKLLSSKFVTQANEAAAANNESGLDGKDGQSVELPNWLSVSQSGSNNNDVDDGNSDEDEETNNQRRSTRATANATPQAVQLPPSSFKSGKTPKKRDDLPQDFVTRCDTCIGFIFGRREYDPMGKQSDTRMKAQCFICGARPDTYCFGCRRYLCFKPPTTGADKKITSKMPKHFVVHTPLLDSDRNTRARDDGSGGDFKIAKEYGQWTCYHQAHKKGWENFIKQHCGDIESLARGKRLRRASFG